MTEIRIPFPGFYESVLSYELDSEESQLAEGMAEECDHLTDSDYADLIWRCANYSTAFDYLAREYVDYFNEWVKDETGVDLDLDLEFVEMKSPREYNFETDKIYCKVNIEALKLIVRHVGEETLEKTVNDHLKSRDGFISFYSDFVQKWKDKSIDGWDYNELYMILCALTDKTEYHWQITEKMLEAGDFYMALDKAIDWKKLAELKADMIAEKEEDHA